MMKKIMRRFEFAPRPAKLKWLMDSDAAVRWQVMRDIMGEAAGVVAGERARVSTEGWGARLLERQGADGHWGSAKEDRGLLTTLYSLAVLKDMGLDPESEQARKMMKRVEERLVFTWLDGRPFLDGET